MNNKYLLIDKKILPDVFSKVIVAKKLLRSGEVTEITEAVKKAGISRSTFYKYKDYVFLCSEKLDSRKATISFVLNHQSGTLSHILNLIASSKGNILTINQDIPINDVAIVTCTFETTNMEIDIQNLINNDLKKIDGVIDAKLIAIG